MSDDILVWNFDDNILKIVNNEVHSLLELSVIIPKEPIVYVKRIKGLEPCDHSFELTTIDDYFKEINDYREGFDLDYEINEIMFELPFDDYNVYATTHNLGPGLCSFHLYKIIRKYVK
jgi:hypothetical protein